MNTKTVNPIIQTERPGFVSDNYGFVQTHRLVELVREVGWFCAKTTIARANKTERIGYTKHKLEFRNNLYRQDEDSTPQLILVNSHDRSTALTFYLGFFRFACENGIIVGGSAFDSTFKVFHSGRNVEERVILAAEQAIRNFDRALIIRDDWRSLILSRADQLELAEQASKLILEEREIDVNPSLLIEPARAEDTTNDAWTVFNRIQEKTVGAVSGYRTKTEPGNALSTRRFVRARPIKSIDRDVKLNQQLFDLANNYFKGVA